MRVEDAVCIRQLIEAAESAMTFVKGRGRADLEEDRMLQFALVQAVQIVGEAASKVSAEGCAQISQVPWAGLTGTRNRLVHAYFDIDLDILWVTVSQALPELLAQLKSLQLPE